MVRRGDPALGGFALARGETQVPGDPRIFDVRTAPVGVEPGVIHSQRQTISTWDSRPVASREISYYAGGPVVIGEAVVAPSLIVTSIPGYVTVVRRMRLSIFPGYPMGMTGAAGFGGQMVFGFSGAVDQMVSLWRWLAYDWYDRSTEVFFVVAPNTSFGLDPLMTVGSVVVDWRAEYHCTAIPQVGLQSTDATGNDPIVTREAPR